MLFHWSRLKLMPGPTPAQEMPVPQPGLSKKDQENTEIAKKLLSERQLRANRANAQKSTGPRTEEGKQHSRLNGLRHGLTGQVSIMTDENRAAHDAFCNPIIAGLAPDGPLETQLAQLIAQDHWRLNRIQAIEDGLFVLGQCRPINQVDSGAPEADMALAESMTFMRQSKEFMLLTLYESRIGRNIRRNMAQLHELQAARKAGREKAFEEAQLLAQLAADNGETFDPRQHGFAFSSLELNLRIERKRQLKLARALPGLARGGAGW
jgi:hypothetical protein